MCCKGNGEGDSNENEWRSKNRIEISKFHQEKCTGSTRRGRKGGEKKGECRAYENGREINANNKITDEIIVRERRQNKKWEKKKLLKKPERVMIKKRARALSEMMRKKAVS